jgi:polar amino acid transport system substrate-binding protein
MKKHLFIFLILTAFFAHALGNTLHLNHNIKQNLQTLSEQLTFLLPNHTLHEKEIGNLFKLYFESYDTVIAFEIKDQKNTLYSAYKDDSSMIIHHNKPLPQTFQATSEISEYPIVYTQNETPATLIVYLKNELNLTQEEWSYLKEKKVLRVQNDSNLTPYNFNENGIPKGYTIDYMNLIANKLGIEVEFVQGNWDDFLNQLETGNLDIVMNMLKSKAREERFLFAQIPYIELEPAMINRIEDANINSFKELEHKTMALVKGYHSYDRVKTEYPNITIFSTDNTLEMIQAVANKKADAAYGLRGVLEYNINKHFITNLKVMPNIDDKSFGFYFAYAKENQILDNIISKAEKLITKKEQEELNQKWFAKVAQTKQKGKNFLFSQEEIDYLASKKKITLCVDPDFMPFEKVNKQGEYVGIIADIINTLSKNTTIHFELLGKSSWDSSLEMVKKQQCDILPFIAQTQSREEYLNFTEPYFEFPSVIATSESELFIDSLEYIKHKPIGVVKNFAVVELLNFYYKDINLVEVNNIHEGLEKVKEGELYGFIGSLPAVAYNIQKYGFQNSLKISGKTENKLLARMGIRKDEIILQSILNKAINSLKPEDTENIINKWLTVVKEETLNTKLFVQIMIGVFILFGVIVTMIILNSNRKLNILNKKLQKLSITDKLTSLYNRTKLDSIVLQEIKKSKRHNFPLCFILADIDYFKNINDQYGHLQGDIILQEFSKLLQTHIRETDYLGRWGGEEFLLILPNTQEKDALTLAEHLRILVENNAFNNQIKVTSSFGVYEYDNDSAMECIAHVDEALYYAKDSTRNCVKLYKKNNK